MLKIDWQPGNFFTVEISGVFHYGIILSPCFTCGFQTGAMIPENFVDSGTSQSIILSGDIRKFSGVETSNGRGFMVPIREVDIPSCIHKYLMVFLATWAFARDEQALLAGSVLNREESEVD